MDKIRIFIVDDNIAIRTILSNLLKKEEDFEVVGEIGSGQGSVIMLEEVNPDIVILEASVSGGMKIDDVIKEMKNIKPDVKVVLAADTFSLNDLNGGSMLLADDLIGKPFKKEVLYRVVRECAKK